MTGKCRVSSGELANDAPPFVLNPLKTSMCQLFGSLLRSYHNPELAVGITLNPWHELIGVVADPVCVDCDRRGPG